MSETTSDTPEPQEGQPQEGSEQAPETFDAEYVSKLRKEAARYRNEARANAEAAKRLAEIEESSKTEAQKQADRIAALERQLQETSREALKRRVQAAYGIPDEDADLFLTGTDEETLTAQAKRLAERESERKRTGNVAPKEGANPRPEEDQDRELVRGLFGGTT